MSPPGDRETSAADEFVRESFRDIKRALETIQKTLSGLHHEYVSQQAYERDRDTDSVEFKAEQIRHDRDFKAIRDEMRDIRIDGKGRDDRIEALVDKIRTDDETRRKEAVEQAKERTRLRWTVIGLAVTALLMLPGSLAQLYQLAHH